jgi:hypothetical protein
VEDHAGADLRDHAAGVAAREVELDQLEPGVVAQRGEARGRGGRRGHAAVRVEADDAHALRAQPPDEVRADEPGRAGDQRDVAGHPR